MTISVYKDIQVPNSTVIEGSGTEYITEAIENIPLLYRNENFNYVYRLEMAVDLEHEITETSDSNNFVYLDYWEFGPSLTPGVSNQTELSVA
jgi:hypothetical protein